MCADGEFEFVAGDTKLHKLAPKVWKAKDCSVEEPLLTFYLRVQYYVDNIGLLKLVLFFMFLLLELFLCLFFVDCFCRLYKHT